MNMKKPVLVIMAAGMGSRYGGLKQIDPIDEQGHLMIDFSIYDAKLAGFEEVICIIKKEMEEEFKNRIGNRISKKVKVCYVHQELHNLPEGYCVPKGREKPWGTAHAVLSCIHAVHSPFAVINADDFYGRDAFVQMYHFLSGLPDDVQYQYAMVGYSLMNTLTEHGSVARGVCKADEQGFLEEITEHTHIEKRNGEAFFWEENEGQIVKLPKDSVVSMNMWGFSEEFLSELKTEFPIFLDDQLVDHPLKCEFFLPSVVNLLISRQKAKVSVLHTSDRWYGVTYKEDKKVVTEAVEKMKKAGQYPSSLWEDENAYLQEAIEQFGLGTGIPDIEIYGNGHINDTYLVRYQKEDGKIQSYIMQRINHHIFHDINQLMHNIVLVTAHLKKKIQAAGGDTQRETLSVFYTKDNQPYYKDRQGNYFRVYACIEDIISYESITNPEVFYESAVAFGNFQYMLSDFDARKLYETIPNFHDTKVRFADLKQAIAEDTCNRVQFAQDEIAFALARESMVSEITDRLMRKEIPLRVTHNDTKLNNILMDRHTDKGICVIDLDTVMPGSALYDFGDAIRFGANAALEDEVDLDKVYCDLELYAYYVKGFIEGCRGSLTKQEVDLLPLGAKMMTFECGIRFLTDYLNGDSYFKIKRKYHNLDRCRTQFKLLYDIEEKQEKINAIIEKYR